VAKGRLAAAERAAGSPELKEALAEGQLSSAQLKIVTEAIAVAPEAPVALLSLIAGGASHQELCDAATRQQSAARKRQDERACRARVHAKRHLHTFQDQDGGIRGNFSCDAVEWARVAPLVEAEAKARWKAAGSKSGESLEAHRVDAFIDLLATSGTGALRSARPRAIVVINAESLCRGTTRGDELCEIEGIGPVSVEAACELIGDTALQFVIRDGVDITTVTGTSRAIKDRIDVALLVRDRTCANPRCGRRRGLERDHCTIDYRDDGPAEMANLARLCARCHDLKTHGGWILGGEPGKRTWDPPPDPPSAGVIDRRRKVAAAKAQGKRSSAKTDRNPPRRT
jgi:hypothetical protein